MTISILYDKGDNYQLTENGPELRKNKGKGLVLSTLLNSDFGFPLDQIKKISGWNKPRNQMREFKNQFNAYMDGSLEIVERDIDGTPSYIMICAKGHTKNDFLSIDDKF